MLYKRMEYFLEAARCLNFSEAARRCHISQQAMTWHIANLEQELGVRLFLRSTRSVQLTEAGSYLRDQFSRIHDDVTLSVARAQEIGTSSRAAARIGIYQSFSHDQIILPVMQTLSERWPNVYFEYRFLDLAALRNQLIDRKLDLIVTTSFTWESWSTIRSVPLKRFPFQVVLAADHPLLAEGYRLERLSELTLLTTESPSQYSSEATLRNMPLWRQLLPKKDYLHVDDINSLLIHLEMKRGFAYLTRDMEGLQEETKFRFFDLPWKDACSDLIACYIAGSGNPLSAEFARALQRRFRRA